MTNVVTTAETEYTADYLLPKKTINKNFVGTALHGTSTSETTFNVNTAGTGSNYYIGRPLSTKSTVSAYNDTKLSTETYFYTNGNITKTEKNANNASETIVETADYYATGNLKSKTIRAVGTAEANALAPRTTSYTYDATNRFIKSITDVEGLTAVNDAFHPLYGVVLQQTNPYGLSTKSLYDNWGKRISVTDFLGKSVNYIYQRTGNVYKTTENTDDGSSSIVESDALGRETRKGSNDINNLLHFVASEYDILGRKFRTSEPYFATASPTLWTTTTFDDYGRTTKVLSYTGRAVTASYDGLTTTSNDEVTIKSVTKNANGHTIGTTDLPGGSIRYSHDANGNMLRSDYEGIVLTMEYDLWGRKTHLNDTSAGDYTYRYNAFGETVYESTPKGNTEFTIDNFGKIIEKHIVGNSTAEKTDIHTNYIFDPNTKLLKYLKVFDPYNGDSSYEYQYDDKRRLIATTENLPNASFIKSVTFDDFGRLESETNFAKAFGKDVTNTTFNTYKYGQHWQIIDGKTHAILWQANNINERGQLTNATLGNGININNTYDAYSFPVAFKHKLNGMDMMNIEMTFDIKRGNLLGRTNSLFNTTEKFSYDANDRLTEISTDSDEILNLPFNSTNDGFVAFGQAVTTTNLNGKMRARIVHPYTGVRRPIVMNASAGQKFKISAEVFRIQGNRFLNAIVREYTADNLTLLNETTISTIGNGYFTADYTVLEDSNLMLSLETDIDGMTGTNGGSIGDIDPFGGSSPTPLVRIDSFTTDNITVKNITTQVQSYDNRGRITDNNLGNYEFANRAKPYQNTAVNLNNDDQYMMEHAQQDIAYTAFKSPTYIKDSNFENIYFQYNAMQQRSAMHYGNLSENIKESKFHKIYSADGSMEVIFNSETHDTQFTTYVAGDAYSSTIISRANFSENDGRNMDYFYLHRDHLGSILAITNSNGETVEKRHFDAWGSLTKYKNINGITTVPEFAGGLFLDRGYTGHEHLVGVGLIHMNGRLYDPQLHRFLQPDNFVQDPYNTQNYNRYGYVLNNPLKYTDPSGEFILVAAVMIGVGVGLATYTLTALLADVPFTVQGLIQTAVVSAFTSAVTFGIGQATAGVANFYTRAAYQALAHGTFNGGMAQAQGGSFINGFAAGSLSSIASSVWSGGPTNDKTYEFGGGASKTFTNRSVAGLGGSFGGSTAGMIAFGTIAGGAGAALTGGNFWQGAVTGLVVSGLNHAMHSIDPPGKKGKYYSSKPKYKDPKMQEHYDEAVTLSEWSKSNAGLTREQIINQADNQGTSLNSQQGGPSLRYVFHPKTGNVIDMRHMLIMGNNGPIVGYSVEAIQKYNGLKSGMNSQDFYSNSLGYEFYNTYNDTGVQLMRFLGVGTNFSSSVNSYLNR